eukprot:UN24814
MKKMNTPNSSGRILKRRSLSKKLRISPPVKFNSDDDEDDDKNLIQNTSFNGRKAASSPETDKEDDSLCVTNNVLSLKQFIKEQKGKKRNSTLAHVLHSILSKLKNTVYYSRICNWFIFICRAELQVNVKEIHRRRQVNKEKQIDTAKKVVSKKKKRVRFCCYDLSAIPPPTSTSCGKPKVSKLQSVVLTILIQAAKEAKTIFNQKDSP